MEKHKDTNSLLKIVPFISALAVIVYAICVFTNTGAANIRVLVSNLLFAIPMMIADFVIAKAYLKHNKNTMKSLIGFNLSGLVMLSMHYAFSYYDPTKWYFIVKTVLFLLIVIFTINQFVLSNNHHSRPSVLFVNQGIMDLMAVIAVIASIVNFTIDEENPLIFISLLIFVLSTMILILSVEMKVNDYKLQREAKGYIFIKSSTTEEVLDPEDMFIGNGLFYSLPWLVLIGLVGLFVFDAIFDKAITWGYSIRYLFFVVKFFCLFALVKTYKDHNKNVMKFMLGFLLGMLLFENICEATFLALSSVSSLKSIVTLVMILVNAVFVILHLQLTKTHASNTTVVNLMKVAYIVYVVLTVIVAADCTIYYFLGKGNNYVFFLFKPLLWILGTLPVLTGILTVDTRVNGFKIKREKA